MVCKNSLSILGNKFSLVYKVLLYVIVVTLILTAVALVMLWPTLNNVIDKFNELEIGTRLSEYVKQIVRGEVQAGDFSDVEYAFEQVIQLFKDNYARIVLAGIFVVLLYFIAVFLISMCYYSVSDIINSFMNSGSKFPFLSNFVHNFKTSAKYSLIYTVINIPLQVAFGFALLGITILASMVSYVLAVFAFSVASFVMFALIRAMFSQWIPSMVVDGMTCTEALKNNFKVLKTQFLSMFGTYFTYGIIMFVLIVTTMITTFGVGTILLTAVGIVFSKALNMVAYYHYNKRKYYKDESVVVDSSIKFSPSVYTADFNEVAEHYVRRDEADKSDVEEKIDSDNKDE